MYSVYLIPFYLKFLWRNLSYSNNFLIRKLRWSELQNKRPFKTIAKLFQKRNHKLFSNRVLAVIFFLIDTNPLETRSHVSSLFTYLFYILQSIKLIPRIFDPSFHLQPSHQLTAEQTRKIFLELHAFILIIKIVTC